MHELDELRVQMADMRMLIEDRVEDLRYRRFMKCRLYSPFSSRNQKNAARQLVSLVQAAKTQRFQTQFFLGGFAPLVSAANGREIIGR